MSSEHPHPGERAPFGPVKPKATASLKIARGYTVEQALRYLSDHSSEAFFALPKDNPLRKNLSQLWDDDWSKCCARLLEIQVLRARNPEAPLPHTAVDNDEAWALYLREQHAADPATGEAVIARMRAATPDHVTLGSLRVITCEGPDGKPIQIMGAMETVAQNGHVIANKERDDMRYPVGGGGRGKLFVDTEGRQWFIKRQHPSPSAAAYAHNTAARASKYGQDAFSFEDNGNAYSVVEYYPGGDLQAKYMTSRRPPTPSEGIRLAKSAIRAMERIHATGDIHADLKAANMLLKDGEVVIVDLDRAEAAGNGIIHGSRIGTPGLTTAYNRNRSQVDLQANRLVNMLSGYTDALGSADSTTIAAQVSQKHIENCLDRSGLSTLMTSAELLNAIRETDTPGALFDRLNHILLAHEHHIGVDQHAMACELRNGFCPQYFMSDPKHSKSQLEVIGNTLAKPLFSYDEKADAVYAVADASVKAESILHYHEAIELNTLLEACESVDTAHLSEVDGVKARAAAADQAREQLNAICQQPTAMAAEEKMARTEHVQTLLTLRQSLIEEHIHCLEHLHMLYSHPTALSETEYRQYHNEEKNNKKDQVLGELNNVIAILSDTRCIMGDIKQLDATVTQAKERHAHARLSTTGRIAARAKKMMRALRTHVAKRGSAKVQVIDAPSAGAGQCGADDHAHKVDSKERTIQAWEGSPAESDADAEKKKDAWRAAAFDRDDGPAACATGSPAAPDARLRFEESDDSSRPSPPGSTGP